MLAVIIPAYNRPIQLEEALKSLTLQTKKRFITIVIDDASKEDISSVVDRYRDKLTIVYMKQKINQGPGAARARGLQWCFDNNIELVMFLDSDDILLPKAIERLSKEISITNSNMVISNILLEDKNKNLDQIQHGETVWTHGKIYRVSFLKQIGLNFPNFRTNEDLSFNIVAFHAAKAKKSIARINEEHYLWTYDKDSITRGGNRDEKICQLSADFIKAIHFSYKKFKELKLDFEELLPRFSALYTYAQYLKELGRYEDELKALIKEIYTDPCVSTLIQEDLQSAKQNIFTTPNGDIYLGRKFMFKQTMVDFIEEHSKEVVE